MMHGLQGRNPPCRQAHGFAVRCSGIRRMHQKKDLHLPVSWLTEATAIFKMRMAHCLRSEDNKEEHSSAVFSNGLTATNALPQLTPSNGLFLLLSGSPLSFLFTFVLIVLWCPVRSCCILWCFLQTCILFHKISSFWNLPLIPFIYCLISVMIRKWTVPFIFPSFTSPVSDSGYVGLLFIRCTLWSIVRSFKISDAAIHHLSFTYSIADSIQL